MNSYWEWVISMFPKTIAPNAITFIGWLLIIISEIIMMCHSIKFDREIPSWCFFFTSFAIFAYQTLDAIDGKQARRTESSSPLGQLFDHGCDSFTLGFFILGVCHAFQISGFNAVFLMIGAQFVFWTSNWAEHHTGVLNTKVGQIGVTEMQLISVLIHLITGVMGQEFWKFKLQSVLFFVDLPQSLQTTTLI